MSNANADFDDRGLAWGKVRSDLGPGVGAGQQWLTLWYSTPRTGCVFDVDDPLNPSYFGCPGLRWAPARARDASPGWRGLQRSPACGGDGTAIGDSWIGCISYAGSPYFSLNNPDDQYWVAVANSEPSFDQCNMGPPGSSHPIIDPISNPVPNLYKIAMEPLTGGAKRAHMIINASDHAFKCRNRNESFFATPFLSLGAQQGHGQAGPVAILNKDTRRYPATISWTSRVYDYSPFACKPGDDCGRTGVHAGFYAISSWNGIKRLLFVDSIFEGVLAEQPATNHVKWSWPVYESFYYPGADIAYMNSASLASQCAIAVPRMTEPLRGQVQTYRVDASALFACASRLNLFSDPMPAGDLPLLGFHWYMESAGTSGWLWMSFEQPEVN